MYGLIKRHLNYLIYYYRWRFKGIPLTYNRKNAFKWFFSRKLVPYLMFSLTYRCQANCAHCGIKDYEIRRDKELKTEEVKKVINQSYNPFLIDFFGGEPF